MRKSRWLSAFLDAVNVSAVALMAAVLILLGQSTVSSWPAAIIALAALVGILRFKLSTFWLILGGAVLGSLFYFLGIPL
jgi:chromate transporter